MTDIYNYIANVNFCIAARYAGVGIVILNNIVQSIAFITTPDTMTDRM